ncbi:hypothetical protein BJV77DRAFT_505873 [Russula vinacea]|nr:hypothetical protein BJV77DRAFT_505873 [Russula vinacea]
MATVCMGYAGNVTIFSHRIVPPGLTRHWASPHSTVHRAGASSLATFKYAVIPYRGHYSSVAPTPILSDHDSKAIQDTLEGLRLMSLLKCVHFLLLLLLLTAVLPMLNSRVPPACPSSPALPLPAIQTRLWTRRPPAPPEINSRDIEIRVFTHRSFAARPTHVFEDSPEDPSPDNEQLSVFFRNHSLSPPSPLTILLLAPKGSNMSAIKYSA